MDKPISVGDLVVCVRTCCQIMSDKHLGKIRRVANVVTHEGTWCPHCGLHATGPHVLSKRSVNGSPVWWVKRIPPLEEIEREKRDEEITA